ncbi:MAG: PEP-CTERM sorting domain-containing protein [Rhodospirillales bacterium]|nr:MAG: PEP-CTERM sorting domain-containing protein [Rhodospirillales bacterium]
MVVMAGAADAAVTFIDRWAEQDLDLKYSIDKIYENNIVRVSYGEDERIPYPSENGAAVVGIRDSKAKFFDIIVDLTDSSESRTSFGAEFIVFNDTPFNWTDYHFVFYNEDFSERLDLTGMLVTAISPCAFGADVNGLICLPELGPLQPWLSDEEDLRFDGSELEFVSWPANEGNYHEVGAGWFYSFGFAGDDPLPDRFGIRQIATTAIPEPGSVAVLGVGLLAIGLLTVRRWRRSQGGVDLPREPDVSDGRF